MKPAKSIPPPATSSCQEAKSKKRHHVKVSFLVNHIYEKIVSYSPLFPLRFEMRSSNSAKKLSLDSSKWAAAETLLNVRKSYISEVASRKTSQNIMTYKKIPWQLNTDFFSVPNYQGISYFCYCLSGCNETV